MSETYIYLCIAVMAVITYILRMIAPVLLHKTLQNKYLRSFVYYAPYVTLSVITVPAIFYCSGNMTYSIIGFAVALVVAFLSGSMPITAALSCLTVFICSAIK